MPHTLRGKELNWQLLVISNTVLQRELKQGQWRNNMVWKEGDMKEKHHVKYREQLVIPSAIGYGLINLFSKGPEVNNSGFVSQLLSPWLWERSHRRYVNEWAQLCSNKIFIRKKWCPKGCGYWATVCQSLFWMSARHRGSTQVYAGLTNAFLTVLVRSSGKM